MVELNDSKMKRMKRRDKKCFAQLSNNNDQRIIHLAIPNRACHLKLIIFFIFAKIYLLSLLSQGNNLEACSYVTH